MSCPTRNMVGMPENPRVVEYRAIADPLERAKTCQQFLVNGRATIKAMEQLRDDAIREARGNPKPPTVDDLALAVGVKRNVVVNALRR